MSKLSSALPGMPIVAISPVSEAAIASAAAKTKANAAILETRLVITLPSFALPEKPREPIVHSRIGPHPEQIEIHAGQTRYGGMIRYSLFEQLQDTAQFEQQATLLIFPHHALKPEERRQPHATRDRCNVVNSRRRVEHHIPRWQFHGAFSQFIDDSEIAAVVIFRRGYEQRCGKIAAHVLRRAPGVLNCGIDVIAV